MIAPWYSLHGGLRLKPFHYFPFPVAKFLRELFFRKKITAATFKELRLYPVTVCRLKKLVSQTKFKIVNTIDTHLRLHVLARIPVVREFAVPSVVLILQK